MRSHHLTGQSKFCRRRAAFYRALANRTAENDLAKRDDLIDMAVRWLKLAETFDYAKQVSGFLEWDAQRLKPPSAFGRP
jgi:hypothetical protein